MFSICRVDLRNIPGGDAASGTDTGGKHGVVGGGELGLSLSKRDGGTYPSRTSNEVVFALLFEMLFALSTIPHI